VGIVVTFIVSDQSITLCACCTIAYRTRSPTVCSRFIAIKNTVVTSTRVYPTLIPVFLAFVLIRTAPSILLRFLALPLACDQFFLGVLAAYNMLTAIPTIFIIITAPELRTGSTIKVVSYAMRLSDIWIITYLVSFIYRRIACAYASCAISAPTI